MSEGEREKIAEELRRVREGVRERALHEDPPRAKLPPGRPLPDVEKPSALPDPPPALEITRPDNAAVNAQWDVTKAGHGGGLHAVLSRLVREALKPLLDAQVAFNSRQVQLDNALLAYVDARLEQTHRQYDAVLGVHRKHIGEIDERHLILQEELVAHVHDLVARIDLALSHSERSRLSLEASLRDVRSRLVRLEERVKGTGSSPR